MRASQMGASLPQEPG